MFLSVGWWGRAGGDQREAFETYRIRTPGFVGVAAGLVCEERRREGGCSCSCSIALSLYLD